MATYQGYQRYRKQREDAGFRIGKVILIVIVFILIYLIARAIFGGGKDNNLANLVNEEETNTTDTTEELSNTNEEADGSSNANTNTNENTNSADIARSTSPLDNCTATYSRGASDRKEMALTFNVGTTKEGAIDGVLEALKNSNTPGSFFATGDVATDNAELIQKISSAGFPIYNYGNSLVNFTDLPESGIVEQLNNANESVSAVTGTTTQPYFRPPFGAIDDDVLSVVAAEGYCPVTWTVDALDWDSDSTAASSKARVLDKASNGAIVLMQAGNSVTSDILPDVILSLTAEGYSFVTLDRLFAE
ncbi:polysaccharide deacetylase family protein [Patescibacteria group bacterium]